MGAVRGRRTKLIAGALAACCAVAACSVDDGTEPIAAPPAQTSPTTTTLTTTTKFTGSSSTSSVPVSAAPGTSGTATSAPATSSTSTSTTADADSSPAFPYWSTTCVERVGDAGRAHPVDESFSVFTTLGAAPSLDLELPVVVTSAGPYGSIAASSAIPGGLLVGVYPPTGWPRANESLASSSLVAVDHDGSIRWRRCFDDVETRNFAVAAAQLEPTTAWVVTSAWDDPLQILGVDLATGEDVVFPADVSDRDRRGGGARFIVLGQRREVTQILEGDLLTMIDVLDGSSWEIPYPPTSVGRPATDARMTVHDVNPLDDEFVLVHGHPHAGDVHSVYVDGSWTEDRAVWSEVLPVWVTATFGEPYELRLFDGAGETIWSVADFHRLGREGFQWVVGDDVVVAMRCLEWNADGICGWTDDGPPDEELVGFDIETGRQLWALAGYRNLAVIDGDVAIASDVTGEFGSYDDGYVLLDLLTGERIGPDGDAWPTGSFVEECCGGYEVVHVGLAGGVVVATNWDHVRVWYAPELARPTATVDLMD